MKIIDVIIVSRNQNWKISWYYRDDKIFVFLETITSLNQEYPSFFRKTKKKIRNKN